MKYMYVQYTPNDLNKHHKTVDKMTNFFIFFDFHFEKFIILNCI